MRERDPICTIYSLHILCSHEIYDPEQSSFSLRKIHFWRFLRWADRDFFPPIFARLADTESVLLMAGPLYLHPAGQACGAEIKNKLCSHPPVWLVGGFSSRDLRITSPSSSRYHRYPGCGRHQQIAVNYPTTRSGSESLQRLDVKDIQTIRFQVEMKGRAIGDARACEHRHTHRHTYIDTHIDKHTQTYV